jgi:amino acid transporter
MVLLTPVRMGAFTATEPHGAAAGVSMGLLGAVLVAMWNYMGWDNASTIAQEVERPRKTYPRAMVAAVVLVSLSYILPFLAVYFTGIPASAFNEDGAWASVAGQLGGTILGLPWLRFMVTLGGMMSAFGMFNALVLSYSRLPLAMARDGMVPKLFGKVTEKNQTPWVSIIVLASCWALCLGLGFKRLVTLDIMLYGAALMLEFVTLVALRIREPKLRRSFRVPGGMAGAVTCGVFPLALLILAMVESDHESILGMNGLLFGAVIMVAGFALYFGTSPLRKVRPAQADSELEEAA